MSTQTSETKPAARTMILTRVLNTPPERVFEAWSKPEHLAKWWAPKGMTTEVRAFELRPGGKFRVVMIGFGQEHGFGGTYKEIVPGKKLVFTSVIDGSPDHEMLTTVTFEAHGAGQTKLTVEQTAPEKEEHARGQKQGWGETIDKLEAYVGTLAKG